MLKLIEEGPLGKKAEISGEDAGLNFLLRIKSKNPRADSDTAGRAGDPAAAFGRWKDIPG